MLKCKIFGHKYGLWVKLPILSFKGLQSLIREQNRMCTRCGKIDVRHY